MPEPIKADTVSQLRLYTYCVILVVIWGSAFTLIGVAVVHITPLWMVTYRLIIGALFLALYIKIIGQKLPALRDIRWVWYTGLGFTGMLFPFTLVATGQLSIDSGLSAILVGVMPLITIILAHFFANERLTWAKFIGFGIGFLGITLLFLPDDLSFSLIKDWKAQLMVLGAAASYAITTVAAKRAPSTPSLHGGAMMLIGVVPLAIIAALFTGPPNLSAPPAAIGAVIALAVLSTALTNILYLHVIELTGPSLLAKLNYFVPPISILLGIIFLNEPFRARTILAFAIIVAGMIITRLGDKRRERKTLATQKLHEPSKDLNAD
ncbi:MAG: EamA family transporter [Litorimonas sp.]